MGENGKKGKELEINKLIYLCLKVALSKLQLPSAL